MATRDKTRGPMAIKGQQRQVKAPWQRSRKHEAKMPRRASFQMLGTLFDKYSPSSLASLSIRLATEYVSKPLLLDVGEIVSSRPRQGQSHLPEAAETLDL